MTMRFLSWVLLLVCLISIRAGAQPDSARIQNEEQFALSLLNASKSSATTLLNSRKDLITARLWQRLIDNAPNYPASTPTIYQTALQVANDLRDQKLIAFTFYKSARYYFSLGNISLTIENYELSKQAFERAGLKRDLIYVLADLGTLNIYSANYERAKQYSEESLALAQQLKDSKDPAGAYPDEYGIGTALSNLGNISKRDGQFELAIDYFQKSLGFYQKIDAGSLKYSLDILDDLADIGRVYRDIGDNVNALSYLNRAMEIAKTSGNIERMAGLYNSLGILYFNQRDHSKAIEFFQQGLQLAVNDQIKQAEMLLNIGVAYQLQRDYDRAVKNFIKAREIAKAIDYKEVVIPVGEGLGAVYKEQGKYNEALDALDGSLELAKQIGDKTRIAELQWRQAEVLYAKGNFAESIAIGLEAVRLADQLNLRNVRYLVLTTLGKAYRAQGQNELAMQTFSKATSEIEEMRGQVVGLEHERQLFFEDKIGPYQEMIDLLLTRNEAGSKSEALVMAERAKGRVLLDVLATGKVDISKAMSDREKEEDRGLNKRIVNLNILIGQENSKKHSDDALLKNLNGQLRSARIQYEAFQDSLYAVHPDLRAKRGQTAALTPREIGGLVKDEKSAFLEYVVTQSKTYLFVLTKGHGSDPLNLRVYSIEVADKELIKQAREFREMLATESQIFSDTARQLYDLLLKPAEEQLKDKSTICIIPDGILWDLPFQALEPKEGRYLLEDYAISYAPSLSVLKEMAARKKTGQPSGTSVLAFGNPTLPREVAANMKAVYRGENLGPLPDAEKEVAALRDIWGPSSSRVFIGPTADKKTFLAEASKYSIIHLATHGILDDGSPMYSRLVMARSENDPSDDGLLEAREIVQLNLHADLVVLSACQTARGRYGAGEGMVGMSWAFFVAGVPTMVASQWKVDSASTAALMINFHRRLKETSNKNLSKADALRQAALDIMKEPRYRHPFYWAGFVMIGSDRQGIN